MSNEVSEKTKEIIEQDLVEAEPPVCGWISTGCTLLDLAISGSLSGGFPIGRVVEVLGSPSSCKTVLGMTAIGALQRKGGVGYFVDIESTFQPYWSEMYGLDHTNKDTFRLSSEKDEINTVEDFFDNYLGKVIKSCQEKKTKKLIDTRYKLVVVDSLSALGSREEIGNKLSEQTMRDKLVKAQMMSASFRKYNPRILTQNKIGIIFISQTRDNIGGGQYAPKEVTSGGRAVSFYSSVRVQLWTSSKVKNKYDKAIGVWVRFQVIKNKVAAPFGEGLFRIMFEYGLDDICSNLTYLKTFQKDQAKTDTDKKKMTVDFDDQSKMMSKMVSYVEENSLQDKLKKEVEKVWIELHASPPRPKRIWT